MRTKILLICALIATVGCSQRSRWPSDVKVGVSVSMTVVGETNGVKGKVLEVEDDWLKISAYGTVVRIARDKVVGIVLVDPL